MNKQTTMAIEGKTKLAMASVTRLLGIMLFLQISLAVILKMTETTYQPIEPTAPLLTCNFDNLTKLEVEENDDSTKTKSSLSIEKVGQEWSIPSYYFFPASIEKVNRIVSLLKGLKRGSPVSTNPAAAEHFSVSANNFQRSLSFFDKDKKINTLYLGSSPRFKTANVRLADSNDIYTVPLLEYELSSRPQDWLERNIAKLTPSEIIAVDMGTFKVQKVKNKWELLNSGKNFALSEGVVLSFLDPLSHLNIISVIDPKKHIELSPEDKVLSYKVTLKDGREVTYSFFKSKETDCAYILKMSNNNWLFPLEEWPINSIKTFTATSLEKSSFLRPPAPAKLSMPTIR